MALKNEQIKLHIYRFSKGKFSENKKEVQTTEIDSGSLRTAPPTSHLIQTSSRPGLHAVLAERLPQHAQLRLAVLGSVERVVLLLELVVVVVARWPQRRTLEVSGRRVAVEAVSSQEVRPRVRGALGSQVLLGELRAEERSAGGEEEGLHARVLVLWLARHQACPRGLVAGEGRVPQLL